MPVLVMPMLVLPRSGLVPYPLIGYVLAQLSQNSHGSVNPLI